MRLHPAASRVARLAAQSPAVLVLFDMPYGPGGASQLREPLEARRAALERFFGSLEAGAAGRFVLTPCTRSAARAEEWLERAGGALAGGPGFSGKAPEGPSRWSSDRDAQWCP